jgi:hypothetical protein
MVLGVDPDLNRLKLILMHGSESGCFMACMVLQAVGLLRSDVNDDFLSCSTDDSGF